MTLVSMGCVWVNLRTFLPWILLTPCIAWTAAGHAQETINEITTGGLTIQGSPTPGLTVDNLEISVDPAWINLAYKLTFAGAEPTTYTFAFALPEIDFSDPDAVYAFPSEDPVNFVDLSTQTDGAKGGFAFRQSAAYSGKDVTALLRGNKLPLLPARNFQATINTLPQAERDRLQRNKLITQVGNNVEGIPLFWPAWSTTTIATKQIQLQPGQKTDITLRYRTSVGMSSDSVLRHSVRTGSALQDLVREKRQRYCVEDNFLAGLDKIAPPSDANVAKVKERRISFSFANAVPIAPVRAVRVTVDKGRPDRVVSFCLDKLTRISPTMFEMRSADFTPDRNLEVLLIGRD